jgi:hypothetical protein
MNVFYKYILVAMIGLLSHSEQVFSDPIEHI